MQQNPVSFLRLWRRLQNLFLPLLTHVDDKREWYPTAKRHGNRLTRDNKEAVSDWDLDCSFHLVPPEIARTSSTPDDQRIQGRSAARGLESTRDSQDRPSDSHPRHIARFPAQYLSSRHGYSDCRMRMLQSRDYSLIKRIMSTCKISVVHINMSVYIRLA